MLGQAGIYDLGHFPCLEEIIFTPTTPLICPAQMTGVVTSCPSLKVAGLRESITSGAGNGDLGTFPSTEHNFQPDSWLSVMSHSGDDATEGEHFSTVRKIAYFLRHTFWKRRGCEAGTEGVSVQRSRDRRGA